MALNKSVCGSVQTSQSLLVSEKGGIQNAVVSLLKIPDGLPMDASESSLKLDQQQCVFIPHVLIVPAGTEFEVLNSDPVLHNFHAIGKQNKEINITQTRTKRRQLPVQFPEPDIIEVVCDVHSWMKAWIIVTEHPYYALTDEEGQFRLENVPEGSYRIKAWHEELGEQVQEVTVQVNQDVGIDFELSGP
ncbi:MAG: carboxypeptidase regulatory-like domain-containing protein [Candidatus Poribacteria bacterium]|nr:carboxypeptidase regulatory-like domain-containing protein [Candidatus Poribacteria bacterium]